MILRVHLFLKIKPLRILAVRAASQKEQQRRSTGVFLIPQIFTHFLQVPDFVDSQLMIGWSRLPSGNLT